MPSFYAGAFALAGLIAAAGPVLIHLLNRRRYRLVNWAAMDFLREALRRNRRMLQLRDFLLLALRTLCVLLFGLALARPYFSQTGAAIHPDQPVHAVLVIDNSLSMSYQKMDRSLLDDAKERAREFIRKLPEGSRISVLPLCGAKTEFTRDAFHTGDEALEALARIQVTDRKGSAGRAADLALETCDKVRDLPAKRVVFIGDQQLVSWQAATASDRLKELPEIQVVQVDAGDPENAWIDDFQVQDGVADLETPAIFHGVIRYQGKAPRHGVPVTLLVDGVATASQTVDLEPGQSREVTFSHSFNTPAEPGKPSFSTAVLSLPPDRLPGDDQRFLVVPVLNSLPVVFVDQYGEDEDPGLNLYGETFRLRRLMVPVTSRGRGRALLQIRHRKIDEVDRELLKDARLVVVAGVESPIPAVDVLREYVMQGGRLVIAAGAEFDPLAWTEAAWKNGGGILPAPLEAQPVGWLPEESPGELKPFHLDPRTLIHDYFLIEQVSSRDLEDLYQEPLFFKAVKANLDAAVISRMVEAETERIEQKRRVLEELRALKKTENHRNGLEPSWLFFGKEGKEKTTGLEPGELALRGRPRVLASFSNGVPFLIERNIGRGQVILVTSGVHSNWNTLTRTNASLMFDRIFRDLLNRTLPGRNLETTSQFLLPIDPAQRRSRFDLSRPGGVEEPLTADALGGESYGLTIRHLARRGHYLVTARRDPGSTRKSKGIAEKLWEIPLAVNGPTEESELEFLDASTLGERMGEVSHRLISPSQEIALAGAQVRGQDLWRWLLLLVLGCLLLELLVLAWPVLFKERTA